MSILDQLAQVEFQLTEAKKVDPKAKVRNKPDAVFDADDKNVKDKKDHFPIDTEGRARNALSQANKYSSSPSWYTGSLESLKKKVATAVKKKYPKIVVTKKATD